MRKIGAAALLLGGSMLSGCITFGGGGAPAVGGAAGGGLLFNQEPLSKSMTYGRTGVGKFHYRYLDGTTAIACDVEGLRGDLYADYPIFEQYRQTADAQQLSQTFAEKTALDIATGDNDLKLGVTRIPVGGLRPGGAASTQGPKGLGKLIAVTRGFFNKILNAAGLGEPDAGGGGTSGPTPELNVLETYVRDGDVRCVLTMHSSQVTDTASTTVGSAMAPAPKAEAPAPPPPAEIQPPKKGTKK